MAQIYTSEEYEALEQRLVRVEELKDAFQLVLFCLDDASGRPLDLREFRALYAIANGLEDVTRGPWCPKPENQEVRP